MQLASDVSFSGFLLVPGDYLLWEGALLLAAIRLGAGVCVFN